MSEPLKPYLNSRVKRREEETEEDREGDWKDDVVCSSFVSCFDWEDTDWEIDEDWLEELD